MSQELDSEMELYGAGPNTFAIIMILVTLVFPVGGLNLIHLGNSGATPFIYSVLWLVFINDGLMGLWYFFSSFYWIAAIWITIPLSLLNLLYIRQLWRYYMGFCTSDSAMLVGLSSLIVPPVVSVYITYIGFPLGLIIPFPFQFICGSILLHKFQEPELVSPWAGIYLDMSWWSLENSSESVPNPQLPLYSTLLEDHEADWLEGW